VKKILIIIIVVISVALAAAFASIYFLMNKANEPTEEEKLKAAQEEIDKLDIEALAKFEMEPLTIQIKRTSSKPDYLVIKSVIYVKDEAMLTRLETLKPAIIDSINGIFEGKTKEELEGKREEMKEPILESIRALFTKQEDKIQIINISITDYKVAQ